MPGPAEACRLALLLALDVSSSVDSGEDRLQRDGLAAAMNAPEVRQGFLRHGPVAFAAFEWSGKWRQDWILPWTMIETDRDLNAAIAGVSGSERVERRYPTAIGHMLGRAQRAFREGPDCLFRTLDVSGDGVNNDGYAPDFAYRQYPFGDITVNALVIGGDRVVARHFREEVIRGPFAFVELASNYADFERAMRRKLARELEPRAIGAVR